MELKRLQQVMDETYGCRDRARGPAGTFMWFIEEVGELARALRADDAQNLRDEFADCLAWLLSVANVAGVDLAEAATRYAGGCPCCHASPCECPPLNKS